MNQLHLPRDTPYVNTCEIVDGIQPLLKREKYMRLGLRFRDQYGQSMKVISAWFVDFVTEGEPGLEIRNGLHYRFVIQTGESGQVTQDLYIRLVLVTTGKLVKYEAAHTDPTVMQVLINHKLSCPRCSEEPTLHCQRLSCTPIHPLIYWDNKVACIFRVQQPSKMGYGRLMNNARLFKLALSSTTSVESGLFGFSTPFYVHTSTTMKPETRAYIENEIQKAAEGVIPVLELNNGLDRLGQILPRKPEDPETLSHLEIIRRAIETVESHTQYCMVQWTPYPTMHESHPTIQNQQYYAQAGPQQWEQPYPAQQQPAWDQPGPSSAQPAFQPLLMFDENTYQPTMAENGLPDIGSFFYNQN